MPAIAQVSEQSRERNITCHLLPLLRFSVVVHGVRLGALTSDFSFQREFEAEK